MNDSRVIAQCYLEQTDYIFWTSLELIFFFNSLFKIMKYSLSQSLNPLSYFQEQIKLIMRCPYFTGL